MSFAALALALLLATYAVAVVLGTVLAVPLFFAAARQAWPAKRARLLVAARLTPSALAVVTTLGLVLPAFLWYEPRDTAERVSAPLLGLAAAGLLMLVAGPARGWLSIRATRRLVRRWAREGAPVEIPGTTLPVFAVDERFPIVALVGWFRPRLVIARAILEGFDRQELAAVLAHEAGHHERRDPWVALLLRACPDLFSMTPWASALERAWLEAAEEDADERAADSGSTRALDLASALVKVTRLAAAGQGPRVLGFALYHGDGVAGRIARLIERPDEEEPSARAEGERSDSRSEKRGRRPQRACRAEDSRPSEERGRHWKGWGPSALIEDAGGPRIPLFAASAAAVLGVAFLHLQRVHRLLEALVSALQ